MAAEATFQNTEQVIQFNAAAAAYDPGEILQLPDGRAAVNIGQKAVAIGDAYGLQTSGIFNIASASATTFSAGAEVYWDSSASVAVGASNDLDGSADFYLGYAVAAKTSGQLTVQVDLNAGWQRLRPFVFEFDTETDTDTHTLIPASMNPNGLQIMSVVGIVTEAFAGGTEDQGIVTIKDNATSPNTICTLTPSDEGADALQDVIQGASQANAILSATGTLSVKVAAGKAVTGAVTQAVSGTGAAGKMRVHIIALPLA